MIWKKTAVLFLCLVIAFFAMFLSFGFGTEAKPAVTEIKTQMPDVSPEVREKAFGLLKEVLAESETLKGNSSKLQMQIEIADLLWENDEPKARTIFSTIFSKAEKEDCLCEISTDENIQKIAARDSKIAMRINYFVAEGGTLDIVFEPFLKQYPEEALEKSKADLAENFTDNFFRKSSYGNYYEKRVGILDRLELIYAQNSKNGADFAKAILAALKDNKPNMRFNVNSANLSSKPVDTTKTSNSKPVDTTKIPNSNIYSEKKSNVYTPANLNTIPEIPPPNFNAPNPYISRNIRVNSVDFSKIRDFFETAIAAKGQMQMLTESEFGELAKLMVNALIGAKKFNSYEIQGIYNDLKKYAPQELLKLEKTLTLKQLKEIKEKRPSFEPKIPEIENNAENSDENSYKMIPAPKNETPSEKAEREFVNNVRYDSRIISDCNIEDDAVIFARIPDKNKYPDLLEYYKDYMPLAFAKTGNIKELRKYLEKESDNVKKIEFLSFAADAVTTESDKNDLAELLKDLKIPIPQSSKNVTEFKVMLNYARILSATSPPQSFEFLENLFGNLNETINSAAVIAVFGEDESQENGELRFTKMREQIAKKSPFSIAMIKKLAHFDFERTKKLADKFARPEVRLFIKWQIANSLLNKNAPAEEAKFYEVDICG